MSELTAGEERDIEEAANRWAMRAGMAAGAVSDLPEAVKERIGEWEELLRKGFEEFYKAALEKGGAVSADLLFDRFQEKWAQEHPEFTDIDELFKECSDEDRANAKKAFMG